MPLAPSPTPVAWLNAALVGFQSEDERQCVIVRKGLENGRGLVTMEQPASELCELSLDQ